MGPPDVGLEPISTLWGGDAGFVDDTLISSLIGLTTWFGVVTDKGVHDS